MVRWINFYRGMAQTTEQDVYVLNTNIWPYVAVRTINMANYSSTGATVKVWIMPNDFNYPTEQYLIIPGWYLPPKNAVTGDASVAQWTGFEVMSTKGDKIVVQASQLDAIAISINGGGSK